MAKNKTGRRTNKLGSKPLNQKSQYLNYERVFLGNTTEDLNNTLSTRDHLETMGYKGEMPVETAQLRRQVIYQEEESEQLFSISKKGKWLLFTLFICIVLLCGIFYFVWFHMLGESELLIKDDTIQMELGSEVLLKPEMFLDIDRMNPITVAQTEMTTSLMTDEGYDYNSVSQTVTTKGKGFLAKGEYPIKFKQGNTERIVILKIADTTPPKITGMPNEIVIEKNARGVDIQDYFAVTDFDTTKLNMASDFTVSDEGNYTLTINAEDESGNVATKETEIKIVSSKEAQKKGDNILTKTISDTTPVSYETEKLIVEGKCKTILNPTGKDKNAISKGQFSDSSDQKLYEAEKELKKAKENQIKAEKQAKENKQQHNNNTNNSNTNVSNQNNYVQNNQTQQNTQTNQQQTTTTTKPVNTGPCDLSRATYKSLTDNEGNVIYNAYLTAEEALNDSDRVLNQTGCAGKSIYITDRFNGPNIKGTDTNVYYSLEIK